MNDDSDTVGSMSIAHPGTSGKDSPPPPVDYVVPFDTPMDGKMGSDSFRKKEVGGRQRRKVIVAAVLNIIVFCVAYALMSRSLDGRELKRPIPSKFR